MSPFALFDQRPLLVAIAGPNGAGKTTFYHAHLEDCGLRFVNADVLARELSMEPYAAASMADALRRELVRQNESFIFETVFSDPENARIEFLKKAAASGYVVVLCYIGLANAGISDERVAMRVSQGGHDVPREKIQTRFPRSLANLQTAIRELPHVVVYDNSDLRRPYKRVAVFHGGRTQYRSKSVPDWFRMPSEN